MLLSISSPPPPEEAAAGNITTPKKKRRPAGTPDPDAEVVSLSPRTLLESERHVCEICAQSFQREQNLQMHRRRHKLPWKLLKKTAMTSTSAAVTEARKRVYVCPETSCLHHHPRHALGDLVGIKKHYRRKHSSSRQWGCARCGRSYAVHSDYKAHLKTCGTRGHSCDCGRVFSRVETFIEHQDSCSKNQTQPPPSRHYTSSGAPPPPATPPAPLQYIKIAVLSDQPPSDRNIQLQQLLPPPSPHRPLTPGNSTDLNLSIAPPPSPSPAKVAAERELAAARRIRQQAQAELDKACAMRDAADRKINSTLIQITCDSCRRRVPAKKAAVSGGQGFGGGEDG